MRSSFLYWFILFLFSDFVEKNWNFTNNFQDFKCTNIIVFTKFLPSEDPNLQDWKNQGSWFLLNPGHPKPESWIELYLGLCRHKDQVLLGLKLLKSQLWFSVHFYRPVYRLPSAKSTQHVVCVTNVGWKDLCCTLL